MPMGDLFVKIARQIASEVDPLWVIDANNQVWNAGNLDADTFHII
jgi:hypothetical protein